MKLLRTSILVLGLLVAGCGISGGETPFIPDAAATTAQASAMDTGIATSAPEASPPDTPTPISTAPVSAIPASADETRQPQAPQTCWVAGDGVRLRAAPHTEGEILDTLSHGQTVEARAREGDWHLVVHDGVQGYIHGDWISMTQPTARPTPTQGPTQDVRVDAPSIVIRKSSRSLELYDGSTRKASYSIGLGFAPEGHKQAEGDGKTPEGEYYVCTRNGSSRYYLSLGLSYPNKTDADAGLADGRIDQDARNRIAEAISAGRQPPWKTALGGEIMIHGHGGDRDWTAGCIAVDDAVMDVLWENCPLGTKVKIVP